MRVLVPLAVILLDVAAPAQVTTASLLEEMIDLDRLTRLPDPAYTSVQLSSTDRRSRGPEQPGWFQNADGFGREPVPGFAAVLREPDADGVGEYLVGEVEGPGAIVRGWSAGMDGTMRVYLDGNAQPAFAGRGYDFLARRSTVWLQGAAIDVDAGDAFVQQDADYFPVPFASSLRVTWEGKIDDLHFYHLQVRRYAPDTRVETLDLGALPGLQDTINSVVDRLRRPAAIGIDGVEGVAQHRRVADLAPGEVFTLGLEALDPRGGAVTELVIAPRATTRGGWTDTTLRGVLLRIAFDGSQRPQVEAPLGDFFGSGPGLNPFASLPLGVEPDGRQVCRFVMPFRQRARIELRNLTAEPAAMTVSATVAPRPFDDRSLYFRAKWRVDHQLDAAGAAAPFDVPYLFVRGTGRLVGAGCMVVNPCPIPTSGGNWWGEGDEKVFVDDATTPALLGTGSEDYFNYAWSRPRLFAHPYCGQPLTTGPGNAGYVSNHRFHILDDVPFQQGLWFAMELWTHRPVPSLGYARIVWHYARPDALDDHRALQRADLQVGALPRWQPVADGGARRSTFHYFEDAAPKVSGGKLVVTESGFSSRGRYLTWNAAAGDRCRSSLVVERPGEHSLHLVLVHGPDGGGLRVRLDGKLLKPRHGDAVLLRSAHLRYARNADFAAVELTEGAHELELECVLPGAIGLEYAWLRLERGQVLRIPGAVEGEDLRVVANSSGTTCEHQSLDETEFSGGQHLWVRAEKVGDFVELEVPVASPGRRRLHVRLTGSWDYGRVALSVNGHGREVVDGYAPRVTPLPPVDLGEHQLGHSFVLRLEVVGRNPKAGSPGSYAGVDCVVID